MNKWLQQMLVVGLSLGMGVSGLVVSAHGASFPLKGKPKPKEVKVNLGIFEGQNDVGAVLPPGTGQFDPGQKSYVLTGAGANIWATRDAFHFLWKKVSGDVSLAADIQFPNPGGMRIARRC